MYTLSYVYTYKALLRSDPGTLVHQWVQQWDQQGSQMVRLQFVPNQNFRLKLKLLNI